MIGSINKTLSMQNAKLSCNRKLNFTALLVNINVKVHFIVLNNLVQEPSEMTQGSSVTTVHTEQYCYLKRLYCYL